MRNQPQFLKTEFAYSQIAVLLLPEQIAFIQIIKLERACG